jgi:alkylation response protein AidB-like acyl-CoA dehydrogenase
MIASDVPLSGHPYLARYAKQRKSFGQPISSLYAIQEKISGMSVRVDAARLLIYKAAMLKDAGKPFIKDAAQAKLYASEAATWCSHQAIQVRTCGRRYLSSAVSDVILVAIPTLLWTKSSPHRFSTLA